MIYRVLAQRVRRTCQRSASRSADYDVVLQIVFSHCEFPSQDQRIDVLDGCPIMPGKVKGGIMLKINVAEYGTIARRIVSEPSPWPSMRFDVFRACPWNQGQQRTRQWS